MRTRQALVLVGGRGTRLGALASATPKPLMALDEGRVFLDEVLFDVARHGFDDILLLAGHLHEQVVARYDGTRVRSSQIRVLVEPRPLGTGGALLEARDELADSFLLLNGDTLFDINFRELDRVLMCDPAAVAALALRRVEDVSRYGSVDLVDGRIGAFHEKVTGASGVPTSGLINGGAGVFRREILSRIPTAPCSIESDVYPGLATAGLLRGAEFSGYFIDIGLPDTLARCRREAPERRRRPAIFFDRDGVLNKDAGYTHRPEDLDWVEGAIDAVRRVNDEGALVIVVTNQAGVARGYYDLAAVDRFHEAMQQDLAKAGAHIDAFYSCPYHPLATLDLYWHADHQDRKPNPGMILRAFEDWPLDRSRSFLIGDQQTDLEAARRAGIPGALFTGSHLTEIVVDALTAIGCNKDLRQAVRSKAGP